MIDGDKKVDMKNLTDLLAALPQEERQLIIGNDTKDGLQHAFDHKRVVHAGINGRPIMDVEQQQAMWKEYMSTPDEGGPRSAYIHIPFCERKCSYCGFFQNASKEEVLTQYTDLLIEELEMTAQYKRAQTGTINAVYFGGGTPSTLSANDIARLTEAVRKNLPLANDCEITLEGRIHDLTEDRIAAAKESGINRFSIGVQSFNTKIRQSVGRIDPEEVVVERLQRLLDEDFATVVIDLMFGLPFQTKETWKYDLDMQYKLGLHGGDLYQLNVFPDSDLARHIDKGIVDPCMPTIDQASLYAWTVDYIRDTMPEITQFDPSHWARSRRERSLYNGLAKQRADMFSFGSSAGGRIGNLQFMQHRNLQAYIAAMQQGLKPIMMMVDDGGMGKFNGDVKSQLEDSYLNGAYFKRVWNRDIIEYLRPVLENWEEKGLITLSHDVVRFTTAGMFWHDNLIQGILDCLNLEEQSHLRNEKVAHQDSRGAHPHAGHPHGDTGHPHAMGAHTQAKSVMGHPHAAGHPHGAGHGEGGKCPHGHGMGHPHAAGHPHGAGHGEGGKCPHGHGMGHAHAGGHPHGAAHGEGGKCPHGHGMGHAHAGGHPHGAGHGHGAKKETVDND